LVSCDHWYRRATAGLTDEKLATDELGTTDEKLATDKEDLEDTGDKKEADEKFLANLKEKCKQTDQEFEQRQKTRSEEISAVGQALDFLSSDEAHDLFTRTFNFLQTGARSSSQTRLRSLRNRAASVLDSAARRWAGAGTPRSSRRLSALAARVKLDAFTKVKEAIDGMVRDLEQEQKDEVKHRDFCVKGFHGNEKKTAAKERDQADLNAKADQLGSDIKTLTAEISDLEGQIAEANRQLKRAGEDREKENAEFQQTIADQRATVKLLNGALNVLKGFYEEKQNKGILLLF
jgi:chromosome segregation ATPase